MFKKANIVLVILSILGIITVSGCVSNNENQSANNSVNNSSAVLVDIISIQNSSFKPNVTTITPGTDVKWINQDKITHKIVSNNGTFESSNLTQYRVYSFTFTKEGVYNYHCAIHPSEKGTIIVK
jgi:Plastocyanin